MNTYDLEIERLLSTLQERIYTGIKAAFEQTRGEIDFTQLADAIANQDDIAIAAALDIANTRITEYGNDELADLFAQTFESVAIIAATLLGHPTYKPDTTALIMRDNLLFRTVSTLIERIEAASIRSSRIMASNAEPPRTVAQYLIKNIGLSDGQIKSLDTFRAMLIRGQRRNTTYFPAAQLRRLNASQRSILRSIVPNEITDDDVERLTNQQRRIMSNHRSQTTARARAYELHHLAQQSAWEQLDRERQIDGYRRFWIHTNDERVRHSHRAIPGLNNHGRGLQEPFQTPHGPTHSPPLEINCRCRLELRKP